MWKLKANRIVYGWPEKCDWINTLCSSQQTKIHINKKRKYTQLPSNVYEREIETGKYVAEERWIRTIACDLDCPKNEECVHDFSWSDAK